MMNICQSCGKPIKHWEKAVEVRYGNMSKTTVENYCRNRDFFHIECDKSFRNPVKR